MSVGKASIKRAVNAEKAAKTETKTEVKEAEVKAAEKPAARATAKKAATAKTTAKKTTTRKTTTRKAAAKKTAAVETTTTTQNVIAGGNADELQAKFLTPKKDEPDNNQPVGLKDELPVYLL